MAVCLSICLFVCLSVCPSPPLPSLSLSLSLSLSHDSRFESFDPKAARHQVVKTHVLVLIVHLYGHDGYLKRLLGAKRKKEKKRNHDTPSPLETQIYNTRKSSQVAVNLLTIQADLDEIPDREEGWRTGHMRENGGGGGGGGVSVYGYFFLFFFLFFFFFLNA